MALNMEIKPPLHHTAPAMDGGNIPDKEVLYEIREGCAPCAPIQKAKSRYALLGETDEEPAEPPDVEGGAEGFTWEELMPGFAYNATGFTPYSEAPTPSESVVDRWADFFNEWYPHLIPVTRRLVIKGFMTERCQWDDLVGTAGSLAFEDDNWLRYFQ